VPESSVINVRKLLRFILENAEVPMQRATPIKQSVPIVMNDLPTGYGQQQQQLPVVVKTQAPSAPSYGGNSLPQLSAVDSSSYGSSESRSEFEPQQPTIQSAAPSWGGQQTQDLPAVAQQSWGQQPPTQQRIKVPSLQSVFKSPSPPSVQRQSAPFGYSVQPSSNDIQPLSYQSSSSYSAPQQIAPSYGPSSYAPSYNQALPQQSQLGLYGFYSPNLDAACLPGGQFYSHPTSPYHFIHCSNFMAYVKACADGTVWNQAGPGCVHPY